MDAPQADPPTPPLRSEGVLDRALALVEFLRARCPWDAEQTPHSLRRYLLEEAHEVVDAIDSGNTNDLSDELGDLLLNLAFQVVIGEETGALSREAVVDGLEKKMQRRHPHLYGGAEAEPWEELKARERRGESAGDVGILAGLDPAADPLRQAHRIQDRVAGVGFDWPSPAGAWEKLREEVDEVGAELAAPGSAALEEEIGDLLFSVVNVARLSGVDAPTALSRANVKFIRRFQVVEHLARNRGIAMDEAGLEGLDRLWNEAKRVSQ